MKRVLLITDGACKGNPGPGGWACILRYGERRREMFGYSPYTTNNRMELAAPIEGLKHLKETCAVEITTDSEYVLKGMTDWIHGWKRRGWMTAEKKPVSNRDLWILLDELVNAHQVRWSWTRGHAYHEDNNRCDELASRAADEQIASEPQPTHDPYRKNAAL